MSQLVFMCVFDICNGIEEPNFSSNQHLTINVAHIGVIRILISDVRIEAFIIIRVFVKKKKRCIAGLYCFSLSQCCSIFDFPGNTICRITL